MEKDLDELVKKLKMAAGGNLKAAALYGSAVTGDYHPKHSDLNVLCVLERLEAGELEKLNPVTAWWARKGYPAPLVFALEELQRFAEVFAIELLDIKAGHRILFGEDVIATLAVPTRLHSAQVERELRTNLVRLRQSFLAGRGDGNALLGLMTASISTFATLFRHALMVMGEQPRERKREAFSRLAHLVGFDAAPFEAVLELREGKRGKRDIDPERTFRAYLEGVTKVADEIDRRLNH